MSSLRAQTSSALFWNTVERGGRQAIQICTFIGLARLLSPGDFGLLAMLAVFIAVANCFINSGLGTTLLQRLNVDEQDYATVFITNCTISLLFYIILFFSSPVIASFFSQPVLNSLLRILALTILVNALGIIQQARMTREKHFRKLALVSLTATVFSGAIALLFAMFGYGVWSLVAQQIALAVSSTILYCCASRWFPDFYFSLNRFRALFTFGRNILFSSVINQIFYYAYQITIGRFYTKTDLGLYSKAKEVQFLPISFLQIILTRTLLPVLRNYQEDIDRLRRIYSKLCAALFFFTTPVLVLGIVLANPLITVILSDEWLAMEHYLKLLLFAAIAMPLHILNLNLMLLRGRSDYFLIAEIAKKALTILAISITFRHGLYIIVIGETVESFLALFINTHFSKKLAGYGLLEQLKDIFPSIALCSIMYFVVTWGTLLIPSPELQLAVLAPGGITLYFMVAWLFKFKPLDLALSQLPLRFQYLRKNM